MRQLSDGDTVKVTKHVCEEPAVDAQHDELKDEPTGQVQSTGRNITQQCAQEESCGDGWNKVEGKHAPPHPARADKHRGPNGQEHQINRCRARGLEEQVVHVYCREENEP